MEESSKPAQERLPNGNDSRCPEIRDYKEKLAKILGERNSEITQQILKERDLKMNALTISQERVHQLNINKLESRLEEISFMFNRLTEL